MLGANLPALSPMDDGTVPMPRLCKLKLGGTSFAKTGVDAGVLYNCLLARLEKGYKLEELELDQCKILHPSSDTYSLLGSVVDKLTVVPSRRDLLHTPPPYLSNH